MAQAPAPVSLPFVVGQPVESPPVVRPGQAQLALEDPTLSLYGVVDPEAELRVTFDEPMVPLAGLPARAATLATLSPPVSGAWRWIDSATAVFAPDAGRLPGATTFTVSLAAGVRAMSGAVLPHARTYTFATTTLQMSEVVPRTLRPASPLAVQLDQPFDVAAVAHRLRVEHQGRALPVRVLTARQAQDAWAREGGSPDVPLGPHQVIVAPLTRWPPGTVLRVVLPRGTSALEGPLLTADDQAMEVGVVPLFTLLEASCDLEQPRARCAPSSTLWLRTSTQMAAGAAGVGRQVMVDGQPVPFSVSARTIRLTAPASPGRHVVSLGEGVIDVHGQALSGARVAKIEVMIEREPPSVSAPSGLQVLDPRFTVPQWVVHATEVRSLQVQLYAVDPVDYFAYQALERGRRRTPPGRKVFEQVIAARAGVEARIDLRPALAATGTGHVVARAVALGQAELDPVVAWIQVSGLAATTQVDGQRLQLWVQELGTGAPASPVAGAQTSLLTEAGASIAESPVVVTSAEGHAVHPLLAPDDRRGDTALLLARAGSDSTFLVLAGEVTAEAPGPVATWYVTDAHFLYKPKETVHVKGWLRWNPRGFDPRLLLPAAAERVAYTLEDVRGAEVAKGSVALSAHGGFAVSVPLPPTVALGRAMFTFEARGQTERHAIEIEDGRTAPFGVRLEAESEAGVEAPLDLQLGEAAELAVSAHSYGYSCRYQNASLRADSSVADNVSSSPPNSG